MGIFTPFCERSKFGGKSFGLSAAGYDVRIKQALTLKPGEFKLASTFEHFNMPSTVLGVVHDKSTWARMGIAVQNTVIEPGWRGYLTLEITNHSQETIHILEGEPIAQILLHRTDEPVEAPYLGKYQDQESAPIKAILE